MPHLIIITPVTRPSNLPAIYNNLLTYVGKNFTIKWMVVFDKNCTDAGREWQERFNRSQNPNLSIVCVLSPFENSPAGNGHRNFALELLEVELASATIKEDIGESWVYFLDDNNILHPDFCKKLHEYCFPGPGVLFFTSTDNKSLNILSFTFKYFSEVQQKSWKVPLSFLCVRCKYLTGLRLSEFGAAYNYQFVSKLLERIPEIEKLSFVTPTFDNYYS